MNYRVHGSRQSGFGLLEALVGLLVFVLLVFVGTKAFKNVVANHKKAAQLKALTDAVTETAERLGNMSVAALTAPKAGYLTWSTPEDAGLGDYVYRYRIVPRPTISGTGDSTLVGLEVETGALQKGAFVMDRSFATLIAPHFTSKDGAGKVSTAQERESEAAFYASLRQKLSALSKDVVSPNQTKLNSFNCYAPDECCDFMRDFFKDPFIIAPDGLKQKCLYRCALSGNVRVDAWNNTCRTNFCSLAPWRSSADCCEAITTGNCPPGSVCASVCYDCVHEDGRNCGPPICQDPVFNDMFDCTKGTFCDGSALPDGNVAGWGNIKNLCKSEGCAGIGANCDWMVPDCCRNYWDVLARGDKPAERDMVCANITKQSDCCDIDFARGFFDLKCTTGGKLQSSVYKGKSYCGSSPFSTSQDRYCEIYKGCSGSYGGSDKSSGGGGCTVWSGSKISGPFQDPFPPPPPPPGSGPGGFFGGPGSSGSKGIGKPSLTAPGGFNRMPSNRSGSPAFGGGGRE